MKAQAAIGTGQDWREALNAVVAKLPVVEEAVEPDLALLFASDSYGEGLHELVTELAGLVAVNGFADLPLDAVAAEDELA